MLIRTLFALSIWPPRISPELDKSLNNLVTEVYICMRADHQMPAKTPTQLHSNKNMPYFGPRSIPDRHKIYLSSSKDLPMFSPRWLRLTAALVEISIRSCITTTFPHLFWTCSKVSHDKFHAHDLITSSYALIRSSYDQFTIITIYGRCHNMWLKSKIVTSCHGCMTWWQPVHGKTCFFSEITLYFLCCVKRFRDNYQMMVFVKHCEIDRKWTVSWILILWAIEPSSLAA